MSGTRSDSGYSALPSEPQEENQQLIGSGNEASTIRTRWSGSEPKPMPRNPRQVSPLAQELDTLFRKWTAAVAQKVQLKRKRDKDKLIEARDPNSPVEILASVFEPWERSKARQEALKGKGRVTLDDVTTLDRRPPMSRDEFETLVTDVRAAIEQGMHPRLNSKGSSGSYFARNPLGQTLGIFKPKDEEPYGRLNPKLTKWLHRNFFSRIIPFGRACLIPNLSYLSESAASLLDRRLDTYIVPRTEVVSLSSTAFYYDWIDRERAARKGRLRDKDGSFQVFMKGFIDASEFLRQHPFPGGPLEQAYDSARHRRGKVSLFGSLKCLCGRAEAEDADDESDDEAAGMQRFRWTEGTTQSFREELEKLVILDYLIRNTDRGLDNFMIKACQCFTLPDAASPLLMTEPPTPRPPMTELNARSVATPPASGARNAHMHIAAIDNSLAFPHAHPSGWRTFNYGWLDLPLTLIGQPFSVRTREHFLPKLSSPKWWAETTLELRCMFRLDPDFKDKMFLKQMAVMKGQAYNVVQSLLQPEEGPVDLCRRPKRLVWDDFIQVADDDITRALIESANTPKWQRTATDGEEVENEISDIHEQVSVPASQMPTSETLALSRALPPSTTLLASSVPVRPAVFQRISTSSSSRDYASPSVRRPTHSKTLSVSSVLSAESTVGAVARSADAASNNLSNSVTGAEMVRHMDWVEWGPGRDKVTRCERRRERNKERECARELSSRGVRGGPEAAQGPRDEALSDQERGDEDEEEEDQEGEEDDGLGDLSWGVVSEGDVSRARSSAHWHDRSPGLIAMVESPPLSDHSDGRRFVARQRSGSLTQLGPPTTATERQDDASALLSTRQSEDVSRSDLASARRFSRDAPDPATAVSPVRRPRATYGRFSSSAVRRVGGRARYGALDDRDAVERPKTKIVVVERLETLKDEPRRSLTSLLCGSAVVSAATRE